MLWSFFEVYCLSNMKKKNYFLMILIASTVCAITAFIISQGLMDYNTSHGVSDTVVDIIDPDQQLEAIKTPVRKLAHLVEYAALGVAIMLLVGEVYRDFKKRCLGFACFYALLVAVVDEHIQSFSDRTSSTADILLDFLVLLFLIFL